MGQKRERPTEEDLSKEAEDRGDNFVPTDDELATEIRAAQEDTVDTEGDYVDEGTTFEAEGSEGTGDSDSGDAADEPRIPKSRLDEVISQREAERAANQELRQQVAELIQIAKGSQVKSPEVKEPVQEFDFAGTKKDIMNAMLEGDEAQYLALTEKLEEAQRNQWLNEVNKVKETAVSEARAEASRLDDDTKFMQAVSKNEADYPFLDGNSESYNQGAVDEVNELFGMFTKAGLSKSQAVQKAVDTVVPKYKQPDKIGSAPDSRRAEALARNASAQNRQPNAMKGKTSRDKDFDELDVSKMTEEQFDKLTKRDIANLRGDFL